MECRRLPTPVTSHPTWGDYRVRGQFRGINVAVSVRAPMFALLNAPARFSCGIVHANHFHSSIAALAAFSIATSPPLAGVRLRGRPRSPCCRAAAGKDVRTCARCHRQAPGAGWVQGRNHRAPSGAPYRPPCVTMHMLQRQLIGALQCTTGPLLDNYHTGLRCVRVTTALLWAVDIGVAPLRRGTTPSCRTATSACRTPPLAHMQQV
jgi:hypothetical protein